VICGVAVAGTGLWAAAESSVPEPARKAIDNTKTAQGLAKPAAGVWHGFPSCVGWTRSRTGLIPRQDISPIFRIVAEKAIILQRNFRESWRSANLDVGIWGLCRAKARRYLGNRITQSSQMAEVHN